MIKVTHIETLCLISRNVVYLPRSANDEDIEKVKGYIQDPKVSFALAMLKENEVTEKLYILTISRL